MTGAVAVAKVPAAPPTFAISSLRLQRSRRHLRATMSSCLRRTGDGDGDDSAEPQDENRAPAAAIAAAAAAAAAIEIGMPYDLKHDVHIHYNFKEARFEGVPANFADLLAPPRKSAAGSASAALSASISSLARTGRAAGAAQRAKRSRTASSAAATPANTKSCNTGGCSGGGSVPGPSAAAIGDSSSSSGGGADGDAAVGGSTAGDPRLLLLNQHFKLHFRQVPRRAVAGYEERIPAVLVMLQEHFEAKQGFLTPHIFRESPSKADRDQAMREINTGQFAGARHDVRVLADLIKLWFRELPVPILHEIRSDEMEQLVAMGGDTAARVAGRLGALERCVVLWLADLLARVAAFQAQNHMGVDQLAIVIAPNLVRIETENPTVAVALSKAAVDLFRAVLRARFQARRPEALPAEPVARDEEHKAVGAADDDNERMATVAVVAVGSDS
ncbi:hypothetical protein PybrP1_007414 [[Pythium] brassicae (nom. inval.)]|nr:hypothetical protein PybrP1_007414 [[Pythium] brassicae (nom. inval.)]